MTDRAWTPEQRFNFATSPASAITLAACGLLSLWSWLAPMKRSLWLDETSTLYFVAGSWTEFWSRVATHSQMAPGYYLIVKAVGGFGMPLELGLRWPSLAAVALASLLLYRLGVRLLDRGAALFAVVVFAALPSVAWIVANARPYAFVVLSVIAAISFLVRWFDDGRLLDAFGFALTAAAAVWMHFTAGAMLVVYAVHALRRRAGSPVENGAIAGVAVIIAALVAPLGVRMYTTWGTASSIQFERVPTLGALAGVLAVPLAAVASWSILRWSNRKHAPSYPQSSPLGLLLTWAVVPPVIAFSAASLSPAQLFVERYFVSMYPAVALLLGAMIQSFRAAWQRSVLVLVIVVGSVIVSSSGQSEDWRGAVEKVRSLKLPSETPILLSSGYVEARDPKFSEDPERRLALSSPLISYPVKGQVVIMPDVIDPLTERAIDRLVTTTLDSDRVVVLSRSFHPVVDWLQRRATSHGFTWRELGKFSGVRAVLAERSNPGPDSTAARRSGVEVPLDDRLEPVTPPAPRTTAPSPPAPGAATPRSPSPRASG